MWAMKRYSDWTKNIRGGCGLSRTFPYIHFTFYSPVYLQGADPSIIQVGEKQPSNNIKRDDKASKRACSVKTQIIKKETVKQEKPPPPAPPSPGSSHQPEVIMLDDESDSDFLEYVSDSKLVNVCPILQSSHRSKSSNSGVAGGHQVHHMKIYMCIHSYWVIGSPNVGCLINEPATYLNYCYY